MSIYGPRTTALGLHGAPAKPVGPLGLRLMINLELSLQLAGSFTGNFCDIQTIPPAQIAQQNDGDIVLVITVLNNGVPQDMSAAHDLAILFQKPDLTVVSLVGSIITNGKDGKIGYNLSPSHLSQAGYYKVQASFTVASVAKSTAQGQFQVSSNLVPTPED